MAAAIRAAAARREGEGKTKTTTRMKIADRWEEGNPLNVFVDNNLKPELMELRKAIQCEVNNIVKFGKQKQEYIATKQSMGCRGSNSCSPEARKERWESCNKDWHTKVEYMDDSAINSNNNVDKYTLLHFKKYGFKTPTELYADPNTTYDTTEFIGEHMEDPKPTEDEMKEVMAEYLNKQGGRRRRRRRKSRKKRRKSRRKSRRKNKSRKRRRRTRRRRR